MNITHYYFDTDHASGIKNNLEHQVQAYLNSLNKSVVLAEDIEDAKKIILDELQKINLANPRCKPFDFHFYFHSGTKNYQLRGFYKVSFLLKAAEHKHMSRIAYHSLSNN